MTQKKEREDEKYDNIKGQHNKEEEEKTENYI